MMDYIAGALAGAAYGGTTGLLKYTLLWRRVIRSGGNISIGAVFGRMGISYIVNALTLLLLFLMRDVMIWDFMIVIVSAALMLSITGRLAQISEIMDHVEESAS